MHVDDKTLPDACNAGFYVRYIDLCRQADVEPNPLERVRELVSTWNRMLDGATFNPLAEHPGGCYTCCYFGSRVGGLAVSCARPSGEHVRSQADRGCAFWEREPGADQ